MASWYSNILTNTTSRITNLQRQVFASEADGDTEDDTHVCRVLRQYYTENGRPLPNWLPPDPKAPPPPAPIVQQNTGPSRYGAPQQGGQSGLSSLWDNNRGAGRGSPAANSRNPFARNAATPDPGREAVQARPLPSQRAGSVQSNSMDMGSPGGGGGGASSAQDRLRQRLYGGGARTTSPSSSTGPFAPPAAQQGGGGMSSRNRGGSAATAGSGDYDPYGPGGQFDSNSGGGGGAGGGGAGSRYGGLPSGPRRMGGLPSGPRMR